MSVLSKTPIQRFDTVIDDIERKWKRDNTFTSLLKFLFATVSILSISLVISLFLSNAYFYSGIKILTIILTFFLLLKFIYTFLTNRLNIPELSKELDDITPNLCEDILIASLLKTNLNKREDESFTSTNLVLAHIDMVAEKLESFKPCYFESTVKAKFYVKPLILGLIFLLLLLIFSPKDFRNYLFSNRILFDDDLGTLELADIRLIYDYPIYTKIPRSVIEGGNGHVKAIRGTTVTFEAMPLRTLNHGSLVIEDGPELPLAIEGDWIRAKFVILSDKNFVIKDESDATKIFHISSLIDLSPKVTIEFNLPEESETITGNKAEIHYKANDDFGLTELQLEWETSMGKMAKLIEYDKTEQKSLHGTISLDLTEIKTEPDEYVIVRVKAYDNDTVSGPKEGISNEVRFKLDDPRKVHGDLISISKRLQEQLLNTLADEIDQARLKDSPFLSVLEKNDTHEDHREDLDRVERTQNEITSEIEEVLSSLALSIKTLEKDNLADYTYFVGFINMKKRINELLEERSNLLKSLTKINLTRFDQLITKEINEFEDDILFIDSTLKGESLRDSLLFGKDMLDEYKELGELIKTMNSIRDQKLTAEFNKKVSELRNMMSSLLHKLSEISGDVKAGFLNPDAFPTLDFDKSLDQISELANNGKFEEALKLLDSLKNSFTDMIASLENGLRSYSYASLSKELMKMNELVSRINNIENNQKDLQTKTLDFKESLLESSSKNLNSFVEKELDKIKMLENKIVEIKTSLEPASIEDEYIDISSLLARISEKTDELRKWLKAFDFNEALSRSRELEDRITGIDDLRRLGYAGISSSTNEIKKSKSIAKEIKEDLEKLLNEAVRVENQQGLSKSQKNVIDETSSLTNDLKKSQKESSFSSEVNDGLDEAKGFMKGSLMNLKEDEISKSITNQDEAIKALSKARGQAQGMIERLQQSSDGFGQSVPLVLGMNSSDTMTTEIDKSTVEIPKPQDSKIGRELKEKMLRALKDGSPDGFSELNKEYYERIIK